MMPSHCSFDVCLPAPNESQATVSLRRTQLWRCIKVAAVFGVLWLLLHVARGFNIETLQAVAPVRRPQPQPDPDLCLPHGWEPFRPVAPDKPRKVYDLMMVNTELDWLEIRINTTFDAVDYFVLVESSKTFTGHDKKLYLKEAMFKFAAYRSKIIYHEIEIPDDFKPNSAWDMEDLQRNSMLLQVFPRLEGKQAPNDGDVLVVSDVDEIPRPETMDLLRACRFPKRMTLWSRFYYYSFQWLHRGPEWHHPQATYYAGSVPQTLKPNDLRVGDQNLPHLRDWEKGDLANASWHCSSCFATVEEFLTKMASFSHEEMNEEKFRDPKLIADHVRSGKDVWERPQDTFDRVDGNTDIPSFLRDNKERFAYMLDRDGPTAGFTDYNE